MEAGPFAGRRLHFVGIGGAGMSGLALVARELGAEVTGSDRAESPYSARLREAGIEPRVGHDEPPPAGAELVVSTAIAEDNPELVRARARPGVPVLHRGDLLGEVSALKRTIAVAGTHGKTTTASMTALALLDAGRDPAFLIGGELRALGHERGLGRRRLGGGRGRRVRPLVPEARPARWRWSPSIELDHHATYRSLGELERAFESFVAPGRAGRARPRRASCRRACRRRSATGSTPATSAPSASSCSRWDRASRSADVEIELAVPGRHNVLNALAALAACRAAGVEPDAAAPALARFTGAGRRFEDHGTDGGGRAGVRRLRAPPDRGARHARRRPHAEPAGAWWRASSRTSTRARACSRASSAGRSRSRTSSWCSTCTPRASAPRTSRA